MSFILDTPQEILKDIARQSKQARLNINLSQEGLASRSGISLASLKRFEQTGKISLESLLKIALVLNSLEDFKLLFQKSAKPIMSLDEIIEEPSKRQRGRKK